MTPQVPAVGRAATLLQVIADEPRTSFTVSELSARTGIHKATCFSTLRTLVELGFLHRDEQRKWYSLGPRLLRFGTAFNDQFEGFRPARVEMFRLASELDVNALLSVAIDDELIVLDRVGTDRLPSRPVVREGEPSPQRPLYGAVWWAWEPDEAIAEWFARTKPDATPDELTIYWDTLHTIRLRGYSIGARSELQQEAVQALRHLGALEKLDVSDSVRELLLHADTTEPDAAVDYLIAPVFDRSGRVAIALTIWGRPGQLRREEVPGYASRLLDAAQRATVAIGGRSPEGAAQLDQLEHLPHTS